MKQHDGTGPTDRCVEHIPGTSRVQLDQLGRVHVKPPDLCAHARMLACMMRACKCVYVCRCVCVSVCMHAWACVRVFARTHVQLRGMSVRAQKRRTAVETTRSISSCRRAPICQGTHVRYRCTAAACLGELRCGCYAARRLPTHGGKVRRAAADYDMLHSVTGGCLISLTELCGIMICCPSSSI